MRSLVLCIDIRATPGRGKWVTALPELFESTKLVDSSAWLILRVGVVHQLGRTNGHRAFEKKVLEIEKHHVVLLGQVCNGNTALTGTTWDECK